MSDKPDWKLPEPDEWMDPVDELREIKHIENAFKSLRIPATITEVVRGAMFTRVEVALEESIKVKQIITLEGDVADTLATEWNKIRIEIPIPGKAAIGVEVPNKMMGAVPIHRIFSNKEFQIDERDALPLVLGESSLRLSGCLHAA